MNSPFIIYSLGRSRTAWLSAFLTYGEWKCYHEVAQRLRSLGEIRQFFALPNTGVLETAAIAARPLLKYICPQLKEVVILRPIKEVVASYLNTETGGLATWDKEKLQRTMERSYRELERLSKNPSILTIQYDELATEEGCKKLFEFCLPYAWDKSWWENAKDQNIQVDMELFFRYYISNRDEIEKFKKQLWSDLRNLRKTGAIMRV